MPPKTDNALGAILIAAGIGAVLFLQGQDGNGQPPPPPPPDNGEPPPTVTPKVTGLSVGYEIDSVIISGAVSGLSIGYEVDLDQPPIGTVTGLSIGYEVESVIPTTSMVTGLSVGYEIHSEVGAPPSGPQVSNLSLGYIQFS